MASVLFKLCFSLATLLGPASAHAVSGDDSARFRGECSLGLTAFQSTITAAGVDESDSSASFESLQPQSLSQTIGLIMVRQFLSQSGPESSGYFVHGETKAGKTKLAVAMARQIATESERSIVYVTPGNVGKLWAEGGIGSRADYDVVIFDGLLERPTGDEAGELMTALFREAVEIAETAGGKKIVATSRFELDAVIARMYPSIEQRADKRAFECKAYALFQTAKWSLQ